MKICVTDDDIRNGQRCRSDKCPVALAAARCFPDKVIAVNPVYLFLCEEQDTPYAHPATVRYALPDEARAAVARFDGNGKMDPFEFELGEPMK